MREWKDDVDVFKPRQKKIYLLTSLVLMGVPVITFLVGATLQVNDFMMFGLGLFLFWGIKYNGWYKMAKFIAEYNIRRKDNKWRNYK